MEFEWDENKNQTSWLKHRVDFADAVHVFLDNDRVEREEQAKKSLIVFLTRKSLKRF